MYICTLKFRTMNERQTRDDFKLRLSGVEVGTYCFSIVCDDEFFELAQFEDLTGGHLDLQVEMEKSEKTVSLVFHFKGYVTAPCDRCLLPVRLPMDFDEHLLVKLVPEVHDGENGMDDEVWVVEDTTYEIDLFHFVYESIVLALPMQIIHEDDEDGRSTCDPVILRKLEELSCAHAPKGENEIDPRWEALRDIDIDK